MTVEDRQGLIARCLHDASRDLREQIQRDSLHDDAGYGADFDTTLRADGFSVNNEGTT